MFLLKIKTTDMNKVKIKQNKNLFKEKSVFLKSHEKVVNILFL